MASGGCSGSRTCAARHSWSTWRIELERWRITGGKSLVAAGDAKEGRRSEAAPRHFRLRASSGEDADALHRFVALLLEAHEVETGLRAVALSDVHHAAARRTGHVDLLHLPSTDVDQRERRWHVGVDREGHEHVVTLGGIGPDARDAELAARHQ